MSKFIVMKASAPMPGSCWGRYTRFAVVEAEDGAAPKMISERAKGIVRIVQTWERCSQGKMFPSGNCAASCALREATEMANALNRARAGVNT